MHSLKQGATPESGSKQPAASTPGPVSTPLAALGLRLGNTHLRRTLQAKLTVSAPQDAFEQEADWVADQVMRMPDTQMVTRSSAQIQRVCDQCDEELHRSEDSPSSVPNIDAATEHSIASLSGRGNPLPASLLSFMEPRFNADFSAVRIHTGAQAHELARSVNAKAFTVGHDVVFGAGYYTPETGEGKRLLAHELTHVIQQQGPGNRLARKSGAHPSDLSAALKPMSAQEAREVLLADFAQAQAGLTDSMTALTVIESTLSVADTAQTHASRLRRLTAAFSLLDQESAGAVLKALNAPAGARQHLLQTRFGHLDRRVRQPLLAILHARTTAKPAAEADTANDPHAGGGHRFVPKWIEVHPGVFALVGEPGMTLELIGKYLSGNPKIAEALAELNGLDAHQPLTAARRIIVPIEYIDRTSAIEAIPEKIRSNIASRRQAMADHAAWNRFVKVRTSGDRYLQKLADFDKACRMSAPYIPKAVASRVGQVGEGLLSGLLDFALEAVIILAVSTAIGALIGGLVGLGAGAIPGAEVGFEIGLLILDLYGLAMLVQSVLSMAGTLLRQLANFFRLFWTADGDEVRLDLAAHALAEAIATLAAGLLLAVFAYLLKKGGKALRNTRFARKLGEKPLAEWFERRRRLVTTRELLRRRNPRVKGLPATQAAADEGVDADGLSDPRELGIEPLPDDTGPDATPPLEPDYVPHQEEIHIPGEGEEITQTKIDPFGPEKTEEFEVDPFDKDGVSDPKELGIENVPDDLDPDVQPIEPDYDPLQEDIPIPGPEGPEPGGSGPEAEASAAKPNRRPRSRRNRGKIPSVGGTSLEGKTDVRVSGFGRTPAPPKPPRDPILKVGGFGRKSEWVAPPEPAPDVAPEPPSPRVRVDGFGRRPGPPKPAREPTLKVGGFKRNSQQVAPEAPRSRVKVGGFAREREAAVPHSPDLAETSRENVGEFQVRGAKQLLERILAWRIDSVEVGGRAITGKDIGPLLRELVAEAKAAGAKRLVFSMELVPGADLPSLKHLVKLLGGTARGTSPTGIEIHMPIPRG